MPTQANYSTGWTTMNIFGRY